MVDMMMDIYSSDFIFSYNPQQFSKSNPYSKAITIQYLRITREETIQAICITDKNLEEEMKKARKKENYIKQIRVKGILGIIEHKPIKYLCLVTEAYEVGRIKGYNICTILDVNYIPIKVLFQLEFR